MDLGTNTEKTHKFKFQAGIDYNPPLLFLPFNII